MTTSPVFVSEFDYLPYVTPLRFDAQRGVILVQQMAVAAPPGIGDRAKRALMRAVAKGEVVDDVIQLRVRTSIGGLRPIIAALDTAYSGIHSRLVSASKLPASVGDTAERATTILEAVFIDGLTFLANDAETKCAESARRLRVIEEKRLGRDIERVAGAGFLDTVKAAHEELREAVGVGATPVRFARGELLKALAELRVAIADYCLQFAAEVDRYDPASVQRFHTAMMPIDRLRADRAASNDDDDEESDEPVVTPPVTPTPGPMPLPSPFLEDVTD